MVFHHYISKFWCFRCIVLGFPSSSDGKVSACDVGEPGSIPGLERSLEKEMETHSSTLAWRIPWAEEPGGLRSTGSQSRTGLSDFTSLA